MSPSRTMLVAGNWKMNTSLDEALALLANIADADAPGIETAVCPPFPWLVPVARANRDQGEHLVIGAQDCSPHTDGAYTGDVSAAMLRPWCGLALAGHSERRHYHHEGDALIGAKLKAIAGAGLIPVLCIGETQEERDAGETETVLGCQLAGAFETADGADLGALVIAYEPVWAIGTGRAATTGDACAATAFIRGWLAAHAASLAGTTRILYGGSVTADNAADLFAQPDVDGALVGGASLKGRDFNRIRASAARLAAHARA